MKVTIRCVLLLKKNITISLQLTFISLSYKLLIHTNCNFKYAKGYICTYVQDAGLSLEISKRAHH